MGWTIPTQPRDGTMAISFENKLFDYLAQLHFDLMSPEVRARFDEYAKNEDFQGHMKEWNKRYVGGLLPDFVSPGVAGVTNDHQLTNDEWKKLYSAFQKTLQRMNKSKNPKVGFDGGYDKKTKDFIAKWFGSDKLFDQDKADPAVEDKLTDAPDSLLSFLTAHRGQLKTIFETQGVVSKDLTGFTYDNLLNGLATKKYNTDDNFRKNLFNVVGYIESYGPAGGAIPGYWPSGLGLTPTGTPAPAIDFTTLPMGTDFSRWFVAPTVYAPPLVGSRIDDFKSKHSNIFSELLDPKNSKILEKFLAESEPIIGDQIKAAVAQTDYTNKDSKDFIPEKYPDSKNWKQRFEDWKNDTYENHLRRFTNPSRGTRLYFSPWSQNIIKAFDKTKLKPTDGLEGILSKKDDVLKNLKSSSTSTSHFKWFAETIENLKTAGMGKAVEGALRNGKQMRNLVSAVIAEAVEQNKIDEAKTALEVLSVAKYGLSCSRTLGALREATKDMSILSDKNLSWNKNEGIQFVTKALDKTTGLAIRGLGLAATGIHNFIQHRRTKIGDDLRKNKVLSNAHKHWNEEDIHATLTKTQNKATNDLAELAAGHGASGHVIDAATIAAETAALGGMPDGPAKDALQKDIDLYNKSVMDNNNATIELANISARQSTRAATPEKDPFRELIAYWDMLESVGKTHAFTLGSMKLKRDAMFKDETKIIAGAPVKQSHAKHIADTYLRNYGTLRTA